LQFLDQHPEPRLTRQSPLDKPMRVNRGAMITIEVLADESERSTRDFAAHKHRQLPRERNSLFARTRLQLF
jgi:hypothetical protein